MEKENIESYLEFLQKEKNKNLFIKKLFLYYPILPVDVFQKFGVKKAESEKDRFHKLIKNISDIKEQNKDIKINFNSFLKNKIMDYGEIHHLIQKMNMIIK